MLLPVPAPYGPVLDASRTRLEGRVPVTPAHITLVPPTDSGAAPLADVIEHVSRVVDRHDPFDVHLRGSGTFRPVSPVVFVGVVDGISACELLAAELRTGLLRSDQRFPYHPHVTVAHDLPDEALDEAFAAHAGFEARYRVTSATLYEQRSSGWHVVRRLALRRVS